MLTAQEVETLQNREPTDWSKVDQGYVARSDDDNARFALDNRLYVRFFTKPRLNVEKSQAANRAIYEEMEYVEIMAPGEKNSIVQRPAWEQDYRRFGKQYQAFKEGKKEQDSGTPLTALPFLNEAQIEELKFFKVHTVEKLANLGEHVMQNFMGARELQQKAQAFISALSSGDALAERNRILEEKVARLEALLEVKTTPEAEDMLK